MTTIDFALDPASRDLVLPLDDKGRADLLPVAGAARIAQAVGVRLRCWLGEWFLDLNHGVPYAERVLGKQRPEVVNAILRAQVLSVAGVQRVDSLTLALDASARVLSADLAATTTEGPITLSVGIAR